MPRPRPVYRHDPLKARVDGSGRTRWVAFVERAFFVFGAVYAAWFAVVIVWIGLRLTWWDLLYLLIFWAVAAYLALPRVHRVLSELYLPDYFIGRVRTGEGLLGDPVNLALRGSGSQVDAAMRRAGWTLADPITLSSARRIVVSSLTGRSYPEAPVSSLFLFGHRQDVAYQQEVENSPARRHHVRLWRCPTGWYLPGGHQADWLAAGTYDRAVGLSLFTLQITHKIDADTDAERDYIVATLQHADPAVEVEVIENFSTGYHHRNGGGDRIKTDGDLPVVDVGAVATEDPVPPPWVQRAERRAATEDDPRLLGELPPRPAVFWVAVVAVVLAAFLPTLQDAGILPGSDPIDPGDLTALGGPLGYLGVATLSWVVVFVPLLVLMLRGHAWARYGLLVLLVSTGVGDLVSSFSGLDTAPFDLLIVASRIVGVLALSDRSASAWIAALRAHRRRAGSRRVRGGPRAVGD